MRLVVDSEDDLTASEMDENEEIKAESEMENEIENEIDLSVETVEEEIIVEDTVKEEEIINTEETIKEETIEEETIEEELFEKGSKAQFDLEQKDEEEIEKIEDTSKVEEDIEEVFEVEETPEDEELLREMVSIQEEGEDSDKIIDFLEDPNFGESDTHNEEIQNLNVKITNDMLLENSFDIKFSSLSLQKFPVYYKNFSDSLKVNEVLPVGNVTLKINNEYFYNVYTRFLIYDTFKLVEFKTREFRFSVSVDLKDNRLIKSQDFFEYEVYSDLRNIRLSSVFSTFINIFSRKEIYFEYKNIYTSMYIDNSIERYKFELLKDTLASYEFICSSLDLTKEKHFSRLNNSFYEIFILEKLIKNEEIDTWINCRINVESSLDPKNNLILYRNHKLNFSGIPFDMTEEVHIKKPVRMDEFKGKEFSAHKRPATIRLKKINKIKY